MKESFGSLRRPDTPRAGMAVGGLLQTHRSRRAVSPPPDPIVVAPRSLATLVVFALGGVLLLAFFYTIRAVLGQLLTAIVLAMALEPLAGAMERRGLPRTPAVIVTSALFFAATAAFVFALLPPLAEGLRQLVREAPGFLERLAETGPLASLERRYPFMDSARAWWAENGGARLVGPPTLRFAKGFLDTGSALATVAFLSLFLLLSGRESFSAFLDVVPPASRPRWHRMGEGVSKAVGGYVFGNLMISVIAGTVATILLLATGVPHALPLGLVVAVFDLIPMVGATIATVIVAVVALSRGVATSAIVVGALVLYQLVENHVLVQAVYHGTVRLSLVAIAVSLAIGAQLGGVAGMLLAIPVAGALKVVLSESLARRRVGSPQGGPRT
jgi:predicted PurR-regulated permease PerM